MGTTAVNIHTWSTKDGIVISYWASVAGTAPVVAPPAVSELIHHLNMALRLLYIQTRARTSLISRHHRHLGSFPLTNSVVSERQLQQCSCVVDVRRAIAVDAVEVGEWGVDLRSQSLRCKPR